METVFDSNVLAGHCFKDVDLMKKIITSTVSYIGEYVPKIVKTSNLVKREEYLHSLKNAVMYMVPTDSMILELYLQNRGQPTDDLTTELCRLFRILEAELLDYLEFLE